MSCADAFCGGYEYSSMSIARNTIYNILGTGLPVLVSVATVPVYLSIVGLERYGVLSICWLLLGYFGLFDFGLGRATAQRIASLASASAAERNAVFWVAASLSLLLALVAALLFVPAALLGFNLLDFQSAVVEAEVGAAIPWLAAAVPLGIMNSVLTGALEGRERFFALNLANGFSTIASALMPLAAAYWFQPQLWLLVAASLAARCSSSTLLAVICLRAVPLRQPQTPPRAEILSLLRFGGWTTVSNVISPLLVYWDRIVIGALIGASAVGIYVVPFNITGYLLVIPAALSGAIFPRLAAASEGDRERISGEAVRLLAFFMTPVTLLALIASAPFFNLWLGEKLGNAAAPVGYILLFGFWMNGLARIPYVTLNASGRPNAIALLHLAEILPYAALLYICLNWFGVEGAALAWSIRTAVDAMALFVLSKLPLTHLQPLSVHALLIAMGVAVALSLPAISAARWAALGALFVAATAVAIHHRPPRISALLEELRRRRSRVRSS